MRNCHAFIPYVILPIGVGAAAVPLRAGHPAPDQRGEQESLIVSHEAEDAVDEVRHQNAED